MWSTPVCTAKVIKIANEIPIDNLFTYLINAIFNLVILQYQVCKLLLFFYIIYNWKTKGE